MDTMPNSANSYAIGPVATLDSSALNQGHYLDCFSGSEREQILGTRNLQRRQERLAGRLAAKFLFLNRSANSVALSHLTPRDLARFTPAEYRSAEVFRSEDVSAGLPQISDAGANQQQGVAIAHSFGLACAYLGSGETISVDLERAVPRTSTFYAGNFTRAERNWVAELESRLALGAAWTYTFLWTVKECLLKSAWFRDLSIADLPSVNVRITAGEEQLVYPHSSQEFLEEFVFLQAEVADRRHPVLQVDLAVSGKQNLILTAVTAVQRRIAA